MNAIDQLLKGYKDFYHEYYSGSYSIYEDLVKYGQAPKIMLIGCSDSRVDPAIITKAGPGEIFSVRNVANLVPPYEQDAGYHGVSAAIEFAVTILKVEHIIILGHSYCGGVRALVQGTCSDSHTSFIHKWMSIAKKAKEKISSDETLLTTDDRAHACELASLRFSIENLKTFPFVAERVANNQLSLHAWHFDLKLGRLVEVGPDEEVTPLS